MTHATFKSLTKKNSKLLGLMNNYDGTEELGFGHCDFHGNFFVEIDGQHQDFGSTRALHAYYNDKIKLFSAGVKI